MFFIYRHKHRRSGSIYHLPQVPRKSRDIIYADDRQIFAHARPKRIKQLIDTVSADANAVADWAVHNKLKLNPKKTTAMFLGSLFYTSRIYLHIIQRVSIHGFPIDYSTSMKNLGVAYILTPGCDSMSIIALSATRQTGVAGALLGLMLNIGGPRSSRRRLYASVVDSILLYGAPAWSEAAKTHDYVRRAVSIHRRACLRVICGFCSISHEASYVLSGISPLELLIDERSRPYHRHLENVGSEELARTIEKWQAQWTHPLDDGVVDPPTHPEHLRSEQLPPHAAPDWSRLLQVIPVPDKQRH
ncbi:unnamed protein product [Trichogramma brassicae]|uniref:Reverse transcriptase domain-containing protein n=1 Tax=Trichogramma brassicae TaxID=86971 RepID=A0A6H5J9Y5_9HYME|nr:unnamed protein product [Trichogramma brassicae]